MADGKSVTVKIFAVFALALTILAGICWIVFLGGFGNQVNTAGNNGTSISSFTGPRWDPYWVVSVLSPILFIVLIGKSILMIISDGLFRKYFIIQILAVIAFILSVIVLCFTGDVLNSEREFIQLSFGNAFGLGSIGATFAGALLEVLFLTGAWICCILGYLFGGMQSNTATE